MIVGVRNVFLPAILFVLLYGTRVLFGIESSNALPALLFSNVAAMTVLSNTDAETSVTFMKQLRDKYPEPLVVIWDNGPAHHGPETREYLTMPELNPVPGRVARL